MLRVSLKKKYCLKNFKGFYKGSLKKQSQQKYIISKSRMFSTRKILKRNLRFFWIKGISKFLKNRKCNYSVFVRSLKLQCIGLNRQMLYFLLAFGTFNN